MKILLAYLDPQSGSIIVQAIFGTVVGAAYLVRKNISGFIASLRKGSKPGDDKDS